MSVFFENLEDLLATHRNHFRIFPFQIQILIGSIPNKFDKKKMKINLTAARSFEIFLSIKKRKYWQNNDKKQTIEEIMKTRSQPYFFLFNKFILLILSKDYIH